jgi:toxin YoeB
MTFTVIYTENALKDIEKLKKTGNKVLLNKLHVLLQELELHPQSGTGKPEKLKGNLTGFWSRRISREHRLVYFINGHTVTVTVIAAYGHY